jgi:1-acyl-sn-glycerol-3-phosphate acyltransferase
MLYALLKPAVSLSLRLFYRRINADSLSKSDTGGPLLLLANHSASFMDAFLIACCMKRRIHFFARGDVFRHRFAEKLLRAVGIMPVFRQSEGRDKLHRNSDSHREATEVLRRSGAVLIFCEGVSDTRKQLKPLKKGPFRLAVQAAMETDIPLQVLPVGINYTDAVAAGGDVYLQTGTPIEAAFFLQENTEAGRAKAATELMRATEGALRPLVWHCSRAESLLAAEVLMHTLPLHGPSVAFSETQKIMAALDAGGGKKMDALADWQRQLRHQTEHGFSFGEWLLLALGAVPAFAGLCLHWLPARLASRITARSVQEEDFIAPVFLCCAILLMNAWYLLAVVGIALFASPGWLLVLPGAVLCGVFYLKIYRPVLRRKGRADRAISRLEALHNP